MTQGFKKVIATGLAALTIAPAALAQQGGPPGDPLGPDLFIAIGKKDTAKVRALLAKGAQTEARNWLGLSPLMWASICGNEEAVRALLDKEADIEGPSHFGTALVFAEEGGNTKVVKLLLDRGAKLETGRADGITPLMMAAGSNHLDVIGWMLERKADVNAADADGATALMYAARSGNTEAARTLIAAGAKIDAADSHGMTAMMYAAKNGRPQTVNMLLQKGASPNARDSKGATAYALAARYAPERETFRLLKARGAVIAANAQRQGPSGMTLVGHTSKAPAPVSIREAAEKSISLIEKTADSFSRNAGCVSCHHQGLALMATGLAKERGFRYDRAIAELELGRIQKEGESHGAEMKDVIGHPEMYKYVPAVDMSEFTPGASFINAGIAAHNVPGNPGLAGMAIILAAQQSEDGRWGFILHREPLQSSDFATTALAIKVLRVYFPKVRAAELEDRIAKARTWLISEQPRTNEDRTFRLLALKWAGAPQDEIARAAAEVKKLQRKDGGWAQFATFRSDAYATGTALYALNAAGMPARDAVYRKGMSYLLRTQDEDGSWYVNKRGIQANTYFDSGFPHGESQYVSYGATVWASMALMLGAEPDQRTAARL